MDGRAILSERRGLTRKNRYLLLILAKSFLLASLSSNLGFPAASTISWVDFIRARIGIRMELNAILPLPRVNRLMREKFFRVLTSREEKRLLNFRLIFQALLLQFPTCRWQKQKRCRTVSNA